MSEQDIVQVDPASADLKAAHALMGDPPVHVITLRGRATGEDDLFVHALFGRATTPSLGAVVDVGGLLSLDEHLFNELIQLRRRQPVVLVGPLAPSLRRRLDVTGTFSWFDVRARCWGSDHLSGRLTCWTSQRIDERCLPVRAGGNT
ncbi:hypothetical protein [Streptomyces bauhiniae]|uniref:hypothetical protein n=1 Tax=Streptomyces bauhiniae TaxID=2340725 RepID=UPI00364BD984